MFTGYVRRFTRSHSHTHRTFPCPGAQNLILARECCSRRSLLACQCQNSALVNVHVLHRSILSIQGGRGTCGESHPETLSKRPPSSQRPSSACISSTSPCDKPKFPTRIPCTAVFSPQTGGELRRAVRACIGRDYYRHSHRFFDRFERRSNKRCTVAGVTKKFFFYKALGLATVGASTHWIITYCDDDTEIKKQELRDEFRDSYVST